MITALAPSKIYQEREGEREVEGRKRRKRRKRTVGGERRKNIPALREHSNWEVTEKTGFELRTCSRVNAIINIRINKGERGGTRRE